jgi:hypothetical protein
MWKGLFRMGRITYSEIRAGSEREGERLVNVLNLKCLGEVYLKSGGG